jgi:hyperosmotically inducible protein
MKTFHTAATTVCALAAAMTLVACDRTDDGRTAGQQVDQAVASADRKADEARQEMRQESREAKNDIDRAVDKAGDTVKDASITTAVNAELARDSELSALRINVDTSNGRVVLRGTAPSESSRQRASSLASRVDGVVSVDNQLSVGSQG